MPGMTDITVLKRGLNGEVTWQYEGRVLKRESNRIVLEAFFNSDDTPFMGVVLKRGDRFVETFYTDRWYNVFEIFDRDDEEFKGWYCNIGYPVVLERDTVSYIDLALDLWVAADGTQTVLDEDEFLALPINVTTRAQAISALEELKQNFANEKTPGITPEA
jgi:predicted RNA-binding protein associated with RNAse of E/G family